mgnify:CR=1 FL=1
MIIKDFYKTWKEIPEEIRHCFEYAFDEDTGERGYVLKKQYQE